MPNEQFFRYIIRSDDDDDVHYVLDQHA